MAASQERTFTGFQFSENFLFRTTYIFLSIWDLGPSNLVTKNRALLKLVPFLLQKIQRSTVASHFILGQLDSAKVSKVLDVFAIFNTKVFLGILFVFLISGYGIFFRFLGIDLLRLKIKKNQESYWLDMKTLNNKRIFKQY